MIASTLRYFRNLNNWTQEYLANILKISQPAYSKLENGFTNIDEKTALILADLYKVDKEIFLSNQYPISNNTVNNQNNYTNFLNAQIKECIDVINGFNRNLENLLAVIKESQNLAIAGEKVNPIPSKLKATDGSV
jgi:transcriptional regulator with XRE-family HTH domain